MMNLKVVNIFNIQAIIFALFHPIKSTFLSVRIVKGNGCSAPQGNVRNGVLTIKKQKDGSAPW